MRGRHLLLRLHDSRSGDLIVVLLSEHHSLLLIETKDGTEVALFDGGAETEAVYVTESVADIAKMLEGGQ